MNNIKQIVEKIIKKGDNVTFRDWEIFCINSAIDLARAYLELENENYRIRCEKQSDLNTISQLQFDLEATEKVYRMNRQYVDDAKSEITKLKAENSDLKYLLDSINKYVIPGELDSSEAATEIIKKQREEIKNLKTSLLSRNIFCDQLEKDYRREITDINNIVKALEKKLEIATIRFKEINNEEISNQRPGGGYSKSAIISFKAIKEIEKTTVV